MIIVLLPDDPKYFPTPVAVWLVIPLSARLNVDGASSLDVLVSTPVQVISGVHLAREVRSRRAASRILDSE